jgi:glycosyltransferase involved in cell wall biosynthesis
LRIAVNTRLLLKGKLEGIGWFSYETLLRMCQAHPEHQFYFFFDRPYDPSFIFGPNVTPIVLAPQARHPVLYLLWFEWSVTQALKKIKADIFISPDGLSALRTHVPTLLVIHDLAYAHYPEHIKLSERLYLRNFVPRYARKATRVATVSSFSKQDIVEKLGVPAHKVDVVYDGVSQYFKPLDQQAIREVRHKYTYGAPYFVYVGSVHPRKNVAALIKAFDLFKAKSNSPVQLVLIGRLAWKTDAVSLALEASPYKEHIVRVDYQEPEELARITGAALALCYVSLFEGFGIPILEAMHAEVPVITSNTSSMPEVIGQAGLLVNPKDQADIAQAMYRIWSDEALRNQLVLAAREQRKLFSWDLTAEKMWQSVLQTYA